MRTASSGRANRIFPRLLISLALVCGATAARAAGPVALPPPTEELLASQPPGVKGNPPGCPTEIAGGSPPAEHRSEGAAVRAGDGEGEPAAPGSATSGAARKQLAVTGQRGAWFLLVDGREYGPYEEISVPLAISPAGDRFACYVKHDKRWFPLVDGVEQAGLTGRFAPGWLANKLAFSPDGRRVAYVAFTDNDKGHLVVDGQAWPECQNWRGSPVRFSRDSQHVAVACHLPGAFSQTAVFVDGKELARLSEVTSYEFRPGTSELAILGFGRGTIDPGAMLPFSHGSTVNLAILGVGPTSGIEPGRKFKQVDTPTGPFGPNFSGPFFSDDGAHVAYSISDDSQVDLYVDGRSVYYRKGTPFLGSMKLSSDGSRLQALLGEQRRSWIVDLRLGADAAGKWSVLETKEVDAPGWATDLFLSPSGLHSAYLTIHSALKAANYWEAVVLDGQPGPHYSSICGNLFPSWTADETLVYVATRAGAQYRVTQRVGVDAP